MDIEAANQTAVEQMMSARPMLTGLAPAREAIPGMKDNLILHAGPPIEWGRMSGPLRGAVIGALLFEGLAKNEQAAIGLVEAGEAEFAPCHHHQTVGPMAGVTSASMSIGSALSLHPLQDGLQPLVAAGRGLPFDLDGLGTLADQAVIESL